MDRNERNLEIVRQTAEILSSGSTLSETFERFCLMLAQFIDASVVFIAIKRPDGAYVDFAYDHGESSHPHRRLNPESQTLRVLQTGQPIFIRTIGELRGPLIPLPLKNKDDSQSAMFVPLRFGAETIGVLSVQTTGEYSYTAEDLHLIETCALYVAVSVHAEAVRSEKEMLQSLASKDALTGVASRFIFDQRLQTDWARAQREGSSLAIIMLDLDWFKAFNDTYGHVAGDACLNQVAQAAQACIVRETDLLARYGGEEFAAILYATEASGAAVVAERILGAIRGLDIPHVESPLTCVTGSIGLASANAASLAQSQALVQAADRALYAAKTAGRDRFVIDALVETVATRQRIAGGNLRIPPFQALGRNNEVTQISESLKRRQIVTITGGRGEGKTRVATAVGQRRMYAYPDGVWQIDCSAIPDDAQLESIMLAVLDASQRPGESARDTLLRELRGKTMLLIFDGCDRLRREVRELCEAIVEIAPQVAMLATCEELLRAAGEKVFHLESFGEVDAIALFVERACTASASFELDDRVGSLIETICTRLEKNPLAIELWASQVRMLSLGQILDAIDGANSIEAAVDWSYQRLSRNAQHLFERLRVFPSDFRSEAVRDICTGDDLEPWDVPEALDELEVANLVKRFEVHGGPRRAIPAQVRDYRHAHRSQDESQALQRRFVRYYRAQARRLAERMEQGRVGESVDAMGLEIDNLREALRYALTLGLDVGAGVDLVVAMRRYWSETGQLTEGRRWIDQALRSPVPQGAQRAELLYAAAQLAHHTGDMLRFSMLSDDLIANDGPDAKPHGKNGNGAGRVRALENARVLYEQALEEYRRVADQRGTAIVLMHLGSLISETSTDSELARGYYMQSLGLFRNLGTSVDSGLVLSNLAGIALREGRYEDVLAFAGESAAVFERLGAHAFAASALLHVAHARIERQEIELARTALLAVREKFNRDPAIRYTLHFFEVLFVYAYETGMFDLAAKTLGFIDRLRLEHRFPRTVASIEELSQRKRQILSKLGVREFERLRDLGMIADNATMHGAFAEALPVEKVVTGV